MRRVNSLRVSIMSFPPASRNSRPSVILSAAKDPGCGLEVAAECMAGLPFAGQMPHFVQHDNVVSHLELPACLYNRCHGLRMARPNMRLASSLFTNRSACRQLQMTD